MPVDDEVAPTAPSARRPGAARSMAVAAVALVVGLGGGAAIGSALTDGDGVAGPTPTSASTTTTTESTTTTTVPSTITVVPPTTPATLPLVADAVQALLLTPPEIDALAAVRPDDPPPAFEAFAYQPVVATNLCGDAIDAEHPPVLVVGTQMSSEAQGLDIVEEVRVFGDPLLADEAADAVVRSLGSCDDLPADTSIDGPSIVDGDVGGDLALAFEMATPDAVTTFVLVELANATTVLSFTRPAAAPPRVADDASDLAIANAAVERLVLALHR
jgi:hypothetical protein